MATYGGSSEPGTLPRYHPAGLTTADQVFQKTPRTAAPEGISPHKFTESLGSYALQGWTEHLSEIGQVCNEPLAVRHLVRREWVDPQPQARQYLAIDTVEEGFDSRGASAPGGDSGRGRSRDARASPRVFQDFVCRGRHGTPPSRRYLITTYQATRPYKFRTESPPGQPQKTGQPTRDIPYPCRGDVERCTGPRPACACCRPLQGG
jgi:hypothetical protein